MVQQELLLNQTYKIHFEECLREYSRDNILAYSCTNLNSTDSEHIAYITNSKYPPRSSLYYSPFFKKLNLSQKWVHLDRIESHRVPAIPSSHHGSEEQGKQNYLYVFIVKNQQNHIRHTPKIEYNENLQKYYIPDFSSIQNKDHLLKITRSILKNLIELSEQHVFHGSIRPDTLFFNPVASYFSRLGECFLIAPGYEQPALYENLYRSICSPFAKGEGHFQDDLYSFGISLLTLFLGHEPLANLNEEEIIHKKLEHGSFLALTQGVKLPAYLQEILQGVLNDNYDSQWNIQEVKEWLEGQHVRLKKSSKQTTASRKITFAGRQYNNLRHLTYGFMKAPEEAQTLIKSEKFSKWLNHSFSDKTILSNLLDLIEKCKTESLPDRYCLSVTSIILCPHNPIFFDGITIAYNGLSGFIFEAALTPSLKQKLTAFLEFQLPLHWLSYQTTSKHQGQFSEAEEFKKIINNRHIGHGFEYLLYKTNPDTHCLSPLIVYQKAVSIKEILLALNAHASTQQSYESLPIDKHILAFLCVKKIKLIQTYLPKLERYQDKVSYLIALLNIYANLQNSVNIEKLSQLAAWIAFHMQVHIKQLKDRKKGITLVKKITQLIEVGQFQQFLIFFNEVSFSEDREAFKRARERYAYIQKEIENNSIFIESPIAIKNAFGRPLAAYCSVFVSTIFLISSFVYFMAA